LNTGKGVKQVAAGLLPSQLYEIPEVADQSGYHRKSAPLIVRNVILKQ
jgi:hypothetical protein